METKNATLLEKTDQTNQVDQKTQELIDLCTLSCELVLKRVVGRFKNVPYLADQDLIFTAGPKSQFYEQIWTRDSSLSILNIMAHKYPFESFNTLNLIFEYQKKDGTLPIRIENNRHWLHYVPIVREIDLIVKRKKPFPVYFNRLNSPEPRDDIPMAVLATQEVFQIICQNEGLLALRWEQLERAIKKEESFQKDGLVSGVQFQDWVDSIHRKGKLSNINILFYRSLEAMASMAKIQGKTADAEKYLQKTKDYKEKIMATFWHPDGYFKAGSRDSRFDSFANILGSLYLIDPDQAIKVQDNIIAKSMLHAGLLKNFDRPYQADIISKVVKLGKMEDYHNHYSWPWITCMNVIAKLKIAHDHSDDKIKERFKTEALADFIRVSQIIKEQGACEIIDDQTNLPVEKHYHFGIFEVSSYKSSPDFLICATVYLQALEKLQHLKLIDNYS